MLVASTCLCRSLSNGGGERAAWLALESKVQRAGHRYLVLKQGPENKFTANRHTGETWIELYELFCSLLHNIDNNEVTSTSTSNMAVEVTAADDVDDDVDDASDNSVNDENDEEMSSQDPNDDDITIKSITISWLLFGCGMPIISPESLPFKRIVTTFLLRVSQAKKEWKLQFRTRIVSCALRLSDVGDWESASGLLSNLIVDDQLLQETNTTNEVQKQPQSKYTDAEISTCICTFLIDRMYSNTYVQRNSQDSSDLNKAIIFGRKAVRLCEQQEQQNEEQSEAGSDDALSSTEGSAVRNQPPRPVALFSSKALRLAASRLALGKAIALLSQHLGLEMAMMERIHVRPASPSQVGHQGLLGVPDVDMARAFFNEGRRILNSSMQALFQLEDEAIDSLPMELLEVIVATRAAIGELNYCEASVYSYYSTQRCSSLTRDAIRDLKRSLRLAHTKFVIGQGIEPTIQAMCTSSALPRSLMLLQAQTAKDSGKVYGFADYLQIMSSATEKEEGQLLLDFALAINLRLHGENHPSISNIRRLRQREDDTSLEDRVNQWLVSPQCCLVADSDNARTI